ncbi:MAG: type II toxin-antitoxin system HicA family toxin [Dehalococcoidia bacterium]|nr:type II toxin-antitoxin system HicA family toxin [Dehalococcoidia bacterium]
MKPQLPVLSGAQMVRMLVKAGFHQTSQRGSHVKMIKELPDRTPIAIVPLHRELAPGTVKSIIRQANLTMEDLRELG